MRFVAVGDVMVDVVCSELPAPASRVHADVSIRGGGSAVNAAAAAAAAGSSAVVIGRVGSDPAGDLVVSLLGRLGVEGRLVSDPDLPTGVAVSLGGEPGVVASRGANARLSTDDVPGTIDADALFVSGFALLQDGSSEAARAALDRFTGAWAGVDLGSPRLAAAAREADLGGAGRTVLLATADEARALTGEEPEDAVRTLSSRFAIACVKLGEGGAIAASGDRVERRAAEPVVRRSPFGAGDAFGAVLLLSLTAGKELGDALEAACRAGARAAAAG
ncbi:MAG TPA: PfkB family carbohydrate kinase [Gaiellaceae bacterium]|nr:PfkB family carbohydrate kinase [Gaiellaceae bacterium]